jgi:hypothetical protein
VPGYAIGFALADLHGGGSEVDEPLNKSGFWSGPAEDVPKALPCLVRFPVPAAVEEVERVKPLRVGGERGGTLSTVSVLRRYFPVRRTKFNLPLVFFLLYPPASVCIRACAWRQNLLNKTTYSTALDCVCKKHALLAFFS